MVIVVGISSCVDSDKDLYQEAPGAEINTSNFSTIQKVQVEIDYSNSESRVPFSIYDGNPLIEGENTTILKENVQALDGAWTDEQGKFTATVELPAYVSNVYIVSTSPFARQAIPGKIVNGVLKVSDTDEQLTTRASYRESTRFDRNRFNNLGWNTNLGSFDDRSGVIDYAYKGNDPKLTLSKSEMNELRTTVSKVLNTLGSCPEEYRTQADLYVEEDETAVVLTALRGWTCWNSSLGYYYYRYDQAPASLKDVKVYAVFPNTQMIWNNGSLQASPQGIKEGTAVQLKYFDDPEYPKGKNFPKGYYIGFILACNAWNTYFTGFNSYTLTEGFYASSTKGFSTKVNSGIDVRTAMFKDKNSNIAIAFEDFMDDQNFTDVVFSLKANPEITNVPPVDEDLNTTIEKTGVYAFEDEWPKAGDYDMNDVLVQYTYQKVFNIFNEILSESFTFKTLYNKSTVFTNGLGFILSNEGNAQSIEYFIRKENEKDFTVASGADKFTRESNAIILTDNVKTNPNAEYKVTFKYGDKNSNKKQETSIDAFIYRPSKEGNRLEVHCPMKKPTSKVDTSLFGQYEDCSKPNEGIYYVSNQENIYPFAFYLSNANANDIAELKNFDKNEKKSISEIYPKFIDWAKYGTNADWYKKK
ncbi:LruC domain-containing protein [Bacteroides ovatus]|jgi:LruC domain-containing protein|uniref:LruC domain-containing protein n=2 Tax=Bacteroides ovatus TaxID=28116 RepID=A0A5M5M3U3_BACOV|nr:LruC domain-containing protein [Bacteroides ovatus]KAA4075555.1 LruC domain-containing protein [Bacteroides ovatus]KAA4094059.1 LruC domain-containing protein [Bacteroides ovatus]KAA4109276.1 LruC domain-containing protein [Bacteroides ovatus]KAA4109430.1 LruC domain-containing protein [Bacteroides ovatus]